MLLRLDRLLSKYLRYRGWVVFWLDERGQFCSAEVNYSIGRGVCWLRCYRQGEKMPEFPIDIVPVYKRRLEELNLVRN